jgi:hypothetical protein
MFLDEVKKLTLYIHALKPDIDSLNNSDKLEEFNLVKHEIFPIQFEFGRI